MALVLEALLSLGLVHTLTVATVRLSLMGHFPAFEDGSTHSVCLAIFLTLFGFYLLNYHCMDFE